MEKSRLEAFFMPLIPEAEGDHIVERVVGLDSYGEILGPN